MKKLLLSMALLMACTFAMAQRSVGTWSLIPKVGVNLANISNFDVINTGLSPDSKHHVVEQKSKYREGFIGGLDVQYQAMSQVAFSAGVFYSVQGMRFSPSETIDKEKVHYTSDDVQWKYDYLTLPLMAHVAVLPGFSFNAGVQMGYLLSAKGRATLSQFTVDKEGKAHYQTGEKGHLLYAYTEKYDNLSYSKRFDVSIPVGFSLEYSHVVLDARYNFGLTKMNKYTQDRMKNKVFTFTVGYVFDL